MATAHENDKSILRGFTLSIFRNIETRNDLLKKREEFLLENTQQLAYHQQNIEELTAKSKVIAERSGLVVPDLSILE